MTAPIEHDFAIRECPDCGAVYDDVVFLTTCPHKRVDGAPVDPLVIFAAICALAHYLDTTSLGRP